MLAGVWPCGIITLLRELFVAESKSQVYGHLHQFLQDYSETANCLSVLIIVHSICVSVTTVGHTGNYIRGSCGKAMTVLEKQ